MLHVILETEGTGPGSAGAKRRNAHITKVADFSSSTFPNIFGPVVKNAGDVKRVLDAGGDGARVLHLFAHGNQAQIGRFADSDGDTFAATDSLARLLRDDLKVFQSRGVQRIVLNSCYGGVHISKLAPTVKHFVLPKHWTLTLEGAQGAAFTDSAGRLRAARNDQSAGALDSAVAANTSVERYNTLLEQHCQAAGQGLESVTIVGEFGG